MRAVGWSGAPPVPVKDPYSPFVKYAKYGLQIELTTICEHPSPQVINNVQLAWQRAVGTP